MVHWSFGHARYMNIYGNLCNLFGLQWSIYQKANFWSQQHYAGVHAAKEAKWLQQLFEELQVKEWPNTFMLWQSICYSPMQGQQISCLNKTPWHLISLHPWAGRQWKTEGLIYSLYCKSHRYIHKAFAMQDSQISYHKIGPPEALNMYALIFLWTYFHLYITKSLRLRGSVGDSS
jgi:hypothetical protein